MTNIKRDLRIELSSGDKRVVNVKDCKIIVSQRMHYQVRDSSTRGVRECSSGRVRELLIRAVGMRGCRCNATETSGLFGLQPKLVEFLL